MSARRRTRARAFRRLSWRAWIGVAALACAAHPGSAAAAAARGEPGLVEPEPRVETGETLESRPPIRVRGEVVETGCFVIGGRHGAEHEPCAIACARAGQDLGILDEQSKTLYLAVVDRRTEAAPNPLLPFIAHRVEVRGEQLEYGELPALIVTNVRSLGRVP